MKVHIIFLALVATITALVPRQAQVTHTPLCQTCLKMHYNQNSTLFPPASQTTPPPSSSPVKKIPARFSGAVCYRDIFKGISIDLSSVCTIYDEYHTTISYTDCGGCELRTIAMGKGPAKSCITIKLPATTVALTKCSPSSGSSGSSGLLGGFKAPPGHKGMTKESAPTMTQAEMNADTT